jgi:hypothetical protein
MMRKDYLVYDTETDTLKGIKDYELELIATLEQTSEVKYERILRQCYESIEDKKLFFERLDEITTFYFNKIRTWSTFKIPVPFLTRPSSLDRIIEVLEALKETYSKTQLKASPQKVQTVEYLRDLFKSEDFYKEQISILKKTDPPMLDENFKSKVRQRERSAWGAWIYVMNHRNFINAKNLNKKDWSILLKKAFNEDVSVTTLGKEHTTAFAKYKGQLLKLTS